MAINVSQSFKRTAGVPIDNDLILSKAQMLAMDDNSMPEKYFAVCKDDGKLYVYDKSAEPNSVTGKYNLATGDESVELTQAQYDALSYEEQRNGKTYYITDGDDGTGGGSAGGGGILKIAEAGVVEFESPIAEGEIKSKGVNFGYNLLPSDLWSVNAVVGRPKGISNPTTWNTQKTGIKLLPVVANSMGSLTFEVLFEKGYTNGDIKLPVYYQFYANVKRPQIGTADHHENTKQDGDLWKTSRFIFDNYYGYEGYLLATALGNAIARGAHFKVAFTDLEIYSINAVGMLDKTRSIVKNANDGATYYPIVWDIQNQSLVGATYLAIHPTEEDKYTVFFTDATTNNAYQYVDSGEKSIYGDLFSMDAFDLEVI